MRIGWLKMSEVEVSVLCITYNHEKYIRDALDSFLNQKTDFRYEILINDDCSTDKTAEIILEYKEKYGEIIRPLLQTENQYSKGKSIIKDILIPEAKGRYIAICEGDDYWTDRNKLQRQYDFMEKNPRFGLCVHNAELVNERKERLGEVSTCRKDTELTMRDVIVNGGDFIATSSTFARMPRDKYIPMYFEALTMDYTWQIFFASNGGAYCFKDAMSVYRIGGLGSWSSLKKTNFEAYKKREINLYHQKCDMRKKFDECNCYKYTDYVEEANIYDFVKCCVATKNYKGLNGENAKRYIKQMKGKEKLKYLCLMKCPFVFEVYKKLRR